jgi:hypothetical protein
MTPKPTTLIRYAVAVTTAVSGYLHADLYVHGYRYLHWIGPMFLLQSAGSFAIALLLLTAGAPVLRLAAAGLAAGALAGFVLSRTVGILGFAEHGWQPAPQAVLTVLTETASLLLLGYLTWRARPRVRAIRLPAARES